MSEEHESGQPSGIAEAVIEEKASRFSAIWAVPLVAVLIGSFLVYRYFADRGPTVTISFQTAEGLEAGKTKIKFKDVEVGLVQSIDLRDDLSGVLVTAEMVKGTHEYLTENTRFWVVRARVAAGRVTGLGTLFSGAYIGMDPSSEGKRKRKFVGLESQPVVTSGDDGTLFTLSSARGGSYQVGSPVYYRQIQVGELVSSELHPSGESVTVQVFVRAPHDKRVRTNTRFWDASGLDVSLDAEGIHVDTASVTSILIGGISFDSSRAFELSLEPPKDHIFPLFAHRAEAFSRSYSIRREYIMHFDQSVAGLSPGAPVVLHGIKMGQVVDVNLEFDQESLEFRVPVLIEIEPERVVPAREVASDPAEGLRVLVERGLRARLKTGNLLTGQKEIELVMIEDAEPVKIGTFKGFLEVPTVPTPLDELTANLASVAERLSKIPFESIGKSLDGTLAQLDQEIMPGVATTVNDASTLLSPDSTVNTELRQLLIELKDAARSLRLMTEYLEQHPEALIQGKEESQ